MKVKYIFIGLLVFTILFPTVSYAGMQENQVFLSGKVTDINTGNPVKCDIKIEHGEKGFKVFSDPVTGEYQQLIQADKDYIFTFYMWDIYRTKINVKFPPNDEYREEKKDFQVIVLKPGVAVEKQKVFADGQSILSPEGEKFLKAFKKTMRFHRTATWNLYVNTADQAKIKAVQDFLTLKYKGYAKKINVKAINASVKNSENADIVIAVDTITKPKN
jgi:hypothetical protein